MPAAMLMTARCEQDDKDAGEDEEHQREDDFDLRLGGGFLGLLTALEAQLF